MSYDWVDIAVVTNPGSQSAILSERNELTVDESRQPEGGHPPTIFGVQGGLL